MPEHSLVNQHKKCELSEASLRIHRRNAADDDKPEIGGGVEKMAEQLVRQGALGGWVLCIMPSNAKQGKFCDGCDSDISANAPVLMRCVPELREIREYKGKTIGFSATREKRWGIACYKGCCVACAKSVDQFGSLALGPGAFVGAAGAAADLARCDCLESKSEYQERIEVRSAVPSAFLKKLGLGCSTTQQNALWAVWSGVLEPRVRTMLEGIHEILLVKQAKEAAAAKKGVGKKKPA